MKVAAAEGTVIFFAAVQRSSLRATPYLEPTLPLYAVRLSYADVGHWHRPCDSRGHEMEQLQGETTCA